MILYDLGEKRVFYAYSVNHHAPFGKCFPGVCFYSEARGCENSCFLKCREVKVKSWMCFKFGDNAIQIQSWGWHVRANACVQNPEERQPPNRL